ncbi:MAG: hypothetical protein H6828_14170 [Planctomycetes bacterium]|nr:hypothetical protein [Planctomycetota bacterium]
MVENNPIQRAGVGGIGGANAPASQKPTTANGPAFQALLEKLQQQAKHLQRDSETVERPEDLSGAVDRAQASLEQALSLSDKLLEAYREAQLGRSAPAGGDAA